MTQSEAVLAKFPEANARYYADLGLWFVIPRRGAYSLEREGWLGSGPTEQAGWVSASASLPTEYS